MKFKNTDDVYNYIVDHCSHILDRPKMYAINPIALEAVLVQLDFIRCSIAGDEESRCGIIAYLEANGFGSASICERARIDGENLNEEQLFDKVVRVWRLYLASSFAPHLTEGDVAHRAPPSDSE